MENKSKMKNRILITLILGIFIFSSCSSSVNVIDRAISGEQEYRTIVVDSCEYLTKYNGYERGYMFTHKGNCKFCLERNKKSQ